MPDRMQTAHDMIKAEADHLTQQQIKSRGELRDARPTDIDYQRGVIDGLRKAEGLLGEGR